MQQRTDPGRDLGITLPDYLQVFLCVYLAKVGAKPLRIRVLKRGIGRGGVADHCGPDAGDGGYRMAGNPRGMEPRWNVLVGKVSRRAARFVGELTEDRVGGFIVSDDAMCECRQRKLPRRKTL